MKKGIVTVIIVIALIVGLVVFMRHSENKTYETKGMELIDKIEAYKQEKGILPESVSEVEFLGELTISVESGSKSKSYSDLSLILCKS